MEDRDEDMPLNDKQLKELEDDYHYWKEDTPRDGKIAVHVCRDQLIAKYGTQEIVRGLESAKELDITLDINKNMVIGTPRSVYMWLSMINMESDDPDNCIAKTLRKSRSHWTLESLKQAAKEDKGE